MQGAPLLAGEVIAFVVDNQIDNRTLGQGCRLVENQPSLLDTCSESAHMATVLDSKVLDKRSRAFTRSAERRFDAPTGDPTDGSNSLVPPFVRVGEESEHCGLIKGFKDVYERLHCCTVARSSAIDRALAAVLRKNLALLRSLTGPRDNHPLNLYVYIVA